MHLAPHFGPGRTIQSVLSFVAESDVRCDASAPTVRLSGGRRLQCPGTHTVNDTIGESAEFWTE